MVYKVTEETVTGIANAIRIQTNSTDDIKVEDFADEILSIKTVRDAEAAAKSALKAEGYKNSAESSATAAAESAFRAEAWAVGKREGIAVLDGDDTYENNALYYAEKAKAESDEAEGYKEETKSYRDETIVIENNVVQMGKDIKESIDLADGQRNAEAWAVGTRNGVAIESKEEHDAFKNNALYWSEVSRGYAEDAQNIKDNFAGQTLAGNVFIPNARVEGVES